MNQAEGRYSGPRMVGEAAGSSPPPRRLDVLLPRQRLRDRERPRLDNGISRTIQRQLA